MMVVLPLPKKPDRTVTAETGEQAAHSGGTGISDAAAQRRRRISGQRPIPLTSGRSTAVQSNAVHLIVLSLLLTLREWSLGGAVAGGWLRLHAIVRWQCCGSINAAAQL